MIKVAINGFGRIGRLAFRLMEENEEYETKFYKIGDTIAITVKRED